METSFNPNAGVSGAKILTREELPAIKDLFLLNRANEDFLLGKSKQLPGRTTLLLPLLLLIIGAIVVGILALAASGSGVMVIAAIVGLVFLILVGWSVLKYQQANTFERDGKLLEAKITSVSFRERSEAMKIVYKILNVVSIVVYIIDLFSDNSSTRYRNRNSTPGFDPGDFYEISLEFTTTTPSGTQLNSKVRANRPDLRTAMPPAAGGTVIALYVNDSLCKLL